MVDTMSGFVKKGIWILISLCEWSPSFYTRCIKDTAMLTLGISILVVTWIRKIFSHSHINKKWKMLCLLNPWWAHISLFTYSACQLTQLGVLVKKIMGRRRRNEVSNVVISICSNFVGFFCMSCLCECNSTKQDEDGSIFIPYSFNLFNIW